MTITHIVNTLQSTLPYLGAIAGVTGLSAIQQKIKNWFELEHPMVIQFVTVVFSFAAAVIPAALGFLSANPAVIGQHTAIVFTGMTLAYRYFVQPASVKLQAFHSDVEAFRASRTTNTAVTAPVNIEPQIAAPTAVIEAPAVQTTNNDF